MGTPIAMPKPVLHRSVSGRGTGPAFAHARDYAGPKLEERWTQLIFMQRTVGAAGAEISVGPILHQPFRIEEIEFNAGTAAAGPVRWHLSAAHDNQTADFVQAALIRPPWRGFTEGSTQPSVTSQSSAGALHPGSLVTAVPTRLRALFFNDTAASLSLALWIRVTFLAPASHAEPCRCETPPEP